MLRQMRHDVWATQTLLERCRSLTKEQLQLTAPGTYGTIQKTLAHIVRANEGYLNTYGVIPQPFMELTASVDEIASRLARVRDAVIDAVRQCVSGLRPATLVAAEADVRKDELLPLGSLVARLIQRELRAEGLPLDTFGNLDLNGVELAKTASRNVLGYMNEMARHCEYAIAESGGLGRCDIERLNGELRRHLHLSRQPPGHFVPIDLIRARSRRTAPYGSDIKPPPPPDAR